jgi:hypothetical protein
MRYSVLWDSHSVSVSVVYWLKLNDILQDQGLQLHQNKTPKISKRKSFFMRILRPNFRWCFWLIVKLNVAR